MNRINLIGRTTKAPERRSTTTGKHVALFTLAVNRRYDREKADFIACVAWGKLADLVMEYVGKGQLIAIVGELHIDNYQTSDGMTKYKTEVVAEEVEFLGHAPTPKAKKETTAAADEAVHDVLDDVDVLPDDEDLPF